jgi:hypothetical protein
VSVADGAFSDALKRRGVDVRKLPRENEEQLCGECGAVSLWNAYGMNESDRAAWREMNASMVRVYRMRASQTEAERQKADELHERDAARCLKLYGAHYAEAHDAGQAALIAWVDDHEAEIVAAWQRAPLAVRRGLAA